MPQGAHTECRHARCAGYAQANGYCDAHQEDAQRSLRGPAYGNLNGANRRFRWMRKAYLLRHPLCAHCKRESATILDHIKPHRGDATSFWSQSNWQGLCVKCHGVKTANETLGRRAAWAFSR